ncbi:hypothetical protein N7488_005994 [Penicillium malachiteum]|nr:hypothetical protein N7488_005994 [Penicillium malachiteum]
MSYNSVPNNDPSFFPRTNEGDDFKPVPSTDPGNISSQRPIDFAFSPETFAQAYSRGYSEGFLQGVLKGASGEIQKALDLSKTGFNAGGFQSGRFEQEKSAQQKEN